MTAAQQIAFLKYSYIHGTISSPSEEFNKPMDDPNKLEFEIWLQYKGTLASFIQAANTLDCSEKFANEAKLLKTFIYHLRVLDLHHVIPESYRIVWGGGQIRAHWRLDQDSRQYVQIRLSINKACGTVVTECPIKNISSITFKEPDIRGQIFRVKAYSETSQDMSFVSQSPDGVPAVEIAHGPAGTDIIYATVLNTNKREVEGESITPSPKRRVRTKRIKRTDTAVTTLPPVTPSRQPMTISSDIPRFIIPPPLLTPSDTHLVPDVHIPTRHETPYESYILPDMSFQKYRVDMSSVHHTLLVSIRRHLGKTRVQLAEATGKLVKEREERRRLEKELETKKELVSKVSQLDVLPLSPPRSPAREDIDVRLTRDVLRRFKETPVTRDLEDGEVNEASVDLPLENGEIRTLSKKEETMAARIEQLKESLRQERVAREAAEQGKDVLRTLLASERQEHTQAEKASDHLTGISSTTLPAIVEALNKLAQLTDKTSLSALVDLEA